MDKDITKYLHYYLGCECIVTVRGDFSENWKPETITPYHLLPVEKSGFEAIKPILRKLESMTDEECWEIEAICPSWQEGTTKDYIAKRLHVTREKVAAWRYTGPQVFHYLLSRGFDLFGLIDAGLAIDKATIKS